MDYQLELSGTVGWTHRLEVGSVIWSAFGQPAVLVNMYPKETRCQIVMLFYFGSTYSASKVVGVA